VPESADLSGGSSAGQPTKLPRPRSIFSGYGLRDFYFRNISVLLYARIAWRQPHQDLFEVKFFERVIARRPDHTSALEALGHLYTKLGEHRKGLEVDERLVKLLPARPMAHYNLACSLSLTGRVDEAFSELALSVRLGYRDFEHLERDSDLAAVRADARYQSFVAMLRSAGSARRL
jgi:hypothetical protein